EAYLVFARVSLSNFGIVARANGPLVQVAPAVERAIHELDRDLPVFAIRSMDQLLGSSLAQRRLTMALLASFAALALLLAGVGVYGVVSYSVRQGSQKLGIRMAVGGQRGGWAEMSL